MDKEANRHRPSVLQGLRVYRVGGYVRDTLMGLSPKDCDWVVVGHTPSDLLALGFKQVGKDFPVFLHPETGEEFALARSERKPTATEDAFNVVMDQSVTLEQDLSRRDFTINAMAMDASGCLLDPLGCAADLRDRIVRHIGSAFEDDPVRILRGARFAARYGFALAPETLSAMQAQVFEGPPVSG